MNRSIEIRVVTKKNQGLGQDWNCRIIHDLTPRGISCGNAASERVAMNLAFRELGLALREQEKKHEIHIG